MKTYYEVVVPMECAEDDMRCRSGSVAFETFEEAVQFADENGATFISHIGGSWDEFQKCWWCEEWLPSTDFGTAEDLCKKCESYLKSREG